MEKEYRKLKAKGQGNILRMSAFEYFCNCSSYSRSEQNVACIVGNAIQYTYCFHNTDYRK